MLGVHFSARRAHGSGTAVRSKHFREKAPHAIPANRSRPRRSACARRWVRLCYAVAEYLLQRIGGWQRDKLLDRRTQRSPGATQACLLRRDLGPHVSARTYRPDLRGLWQRAPTCELHQHRALRPDGSIRANRMPVRDHGANLPKPARARLVSFKAFATGVLTPAGGDAA